jgi:uncharacterized protein YbaR (Trm112 family)
MNQKLLKILACPKCIGSLQQKDNTLACTKCTQRYRIEDDIPIMLIEETTKTQ